jgi:butyryl-CoA dehydrogenase
VVVAERGTAGFVVGDLEDLCGMRANPVCSIRLNDCRVPTANLLAKEGMGLKIGLAALDTGRMGIGAQAVGIAQAALEEAVRYARQRQQFGVPIGRHQAIQTMIADMATQVDAARLMVYRAAALKERQSALFQRIGHGQAVCLRGRHAGHRPGCPDPWRLRIQQVLPGGTLLPGRPGHPHL